MSTIPLVSERATVPVWPDAGQLLGYTSKSAAYRAAANGFSPTVKLSPRRIMVPTAALRAMLSLPLDGAQ